MKPGGVKPSSERSVRIVGGGLTGVLAAFEAHRLGFRDITLFERFAALGGVALPRERGGLELREGCIYFGPPGDPVRDALEAHGLVFEDVANSFGSLSPGDVVTHDFGGPSLACPEISLTRPTGPSLANRLRAYPTAVEAELARYCRWHLGADLAAVHESAAIPLAINRVHPRGADLAAVAQAKRRSPLADELYAIPRSLWSRTANLTAALPRDGFPALFRAARAALEGLGVQMREETLVSPRQALAEHGPGQVLVWAANPTPMFKALGLATPRPLAKSFAAYTLKARWTGPRPFYAQNFTSKGAVFRAYVYESRGQTLITAECVREADDAALRADLHRLMAGFGSGLELLETLGVVIQPRWIYHTTEAIAGLAALRAEAARRMGPDFVAGAWEPYGKAQKFTEVSQALARSWENAAWQADGAALPAAANAA